MIGQSAPAQRGATALLLVVVAALVAQPARADLVSAGAAYQRGDYAKAFHEFSELAQLGQPTAQFNIAVMYARGQGTRQSDIYAYAWASLAAANGMEKASKLADQLRPGLAPGSEKIAADIEAQYGNAMLDARLNPKLVESEAAAERDQRRRCTVVKAYIPQYPADARSKRVEGGIYVEYSVMPDGRSRVPRIIFAVPSGVFEATVRDSLLHSEFAPSPAGQPPTRCTLFYRFVLNGMTIGDSPRLLAFVNDTERRAQAGDPEAQTLYGMLLIGLPQLNKPRSQGLPWFLKAARAGDPIAEFQVGYSALVGWGCDCEVNKGLDWLRRAAQAGQPDAEVVLAMYALRGEPDEERLRQAKLWLEQAAASGSHDGKLYLAALLAASPGEGRDPKRALALLDEVFRGVDDDPSAYEIRAAAQANAGDFRDAVKSEEKALAKAQRLKWDVAPLNARLARYVANEAWYGSLLDF
jgi:TPR repeat protein